MSALAAKIREQSSSVVEGRDAAGAAAELKRQYTETVRLLDADQQARAATATAMRRRHLAPMQRIAAERRAYGGSHGLSVAERAALAVVAEAASTLDALLSWPPAHSLRPIDTERQVAAIRRRFDGRIAAADRYDKDVCAYESAIRRNARQVVDAAVPVLNHWRAAAIAAEAELATRSAPTRCRTARVSGAVVGLPIAYQQIDPSISGAVTTWQTIYGAARRIAATR